MTIRKLREELRRGKTIYDLPLRVTFYARVSTEKPEQQDNQEAPLLLNNVCRIIAKRPPERAAL